MPRMNATIAGFNPSWTRGTLAFLPTTRNSSFLDDSVSHTAASLNDEAEGHARLRSQNRPGPTGLPGADAVHRTERTSERLGRTVAVPHRDFEQRPLAGDNLGVRDRESPAPDVLRQRDASQRGEHPSEVVLRRECDPRQLTHLDSLVEVLLDVVHGLVQPIQHARSFP